MSLSRIIYTLLFFVACWSAYYLFDKEQTFDIQVTPDQELPMFSGTNMENVSYAEDGIRSYIITSTHLDHFAKSGDTEFDFPVLKIYKEGVIQEWEITADRAILSEEQVLTLYDNVLAKNLLSDSGFDTMSTDEMSIKLDNRDFWADNRVVLVGPQFETEGQAMKGNFADNTAVLYNHVQGRYETLTP
ncbi:LPS export ABC transporter periplasmic protein LptC [Vibrio sp. SCSIO 43135]|uniref:Lipopolysaccharide export system protein LptC n=1 Tax=Vibrio paucivorans TaxID=2829489 RepID=A0A9X3HPZ9_9VIBR|nr:MULTISPECIES: LPS export ABC transporter periplasmic protein LptC [Vibrio]MCW8333145.1 LPS export ABC transporter periplasmic protein LptC [Vibrio paucivorans]USD41466.1 LPS export ABC transporter periplasmic protein LptC [Vibrio sp. SCSIO 43135]